MGGLAEPPPVPRPPAPYMGCREKHPITLSETPRPLKNNILRYGYVLESTHFPCVLHTLSPCTSAVKSNSDIQVKLQSRTVKVLTER